MFGVPAIFRCDNDPGFTSSVMKAFAALLGVKAFDFSAPDNPTHHGTVERRNRVMEKLLDVAISKGDLNSSADLHMYCAMATATCNLEHVFNGHTVLEYLTGEVPRTPELPCTVNGDMVPATVHTDTVRMYGRVYGQVGHARICPSSDFPRT